jgi:hypothetical protein
MKNHFLSGFDAGDLKKTIILLLTGIFFIFNILAICLCDV